MNRFVASIFKFRMMEETQREYKIKRKFRELFHVSNSRQSTIEENL